MCQLREQLFAIGTDPGPSRAAMARHDCASGRRDCWDVDCHSDGTQACSAVDCDGDDVGDFSQSC